jgi:dihydrofolate reductase
VGGWRGGLTAGNRGAGGMNGIFMTMSVVVTGDHFIAESGVSGITFSSVEDKAVFRTFLRSGECDCFVCGLKSENYYVSRFSLKPLFVLAHKPMRDHGGVVYFQDMDGFLEKLAAGGFSRPALLGGARTYDYFLQKNMVDKAYVLVERNVALVDGVKFDFKNYADGFMLQDKKNLSLNTEMSTYVRRA